MKLPQVHQQVDIILILIYVGNRLNLICQTGHGFSKFPLRFSVTLDAESSTNIYFDIADETTIGRGLDTVTVSSDNRQLQLELFKATDSILEMAAQEGETPGCAS